VIPCLGACTSKSLSTSPNGDDSGVRTGSGDGGEGGGPVSSECSRVIRAEETNIVTQEDVEGMRGVRRVEGNLFIGVGPPGETRVSTGTDLEARGCLSVVEGIRSTGGNPLLPNLAGLSGVEQAQDFRLQSNEQLVDTSALAGLRSAAYFVFVVRNPLLTRLG